MFSLSHDLASSLPFTNPLEASCDSKVSSGTSTSTSTVFEYYEFGHTTLWCTVFCILYTGASQKI